MVIGLVILTFAAFILIDIALKYRAEKRRHLAGRDEISHSNPSRIAHLIPQMEGYELPDGFFFHPGHTWAYFRTLHGARIGIDDFAKQIMGKIDSVDLPPVGTKVSQGEKILAMTQGERRVEFVSPLDGVVESVNERLQKAPEAAMENPYCEGWALEVLPTNRLANLMKLKVGTQSKSWYLNEIERLKDFVSSFMGEPQAVGVTAQDGGLPMEGILRDMDDELFRKFETMFLKG